MTNLVGATVQYNGESYVTNALGLVTIPGDKVKQDVTKLEVSHYVENSYPKVVRTDFEVAIQPAY